MVERDPLTPTELMVIALVAEGLTDREIARESGRAHSTVKTHVHNSMRKLHAQTRAQAVVICIRKGWLI